MKLLPGPGLLRLGKAEWPAVLARLKARGYAWRGVQGGGKLWSPDGRVCVGEFRQGAYWLDACVRGDLTADS